MFWLPASSAFEPPFHVWIVLLGGITALLGWAVHEIRSRRAQSWPVVDGTVESHLFYVEGFGQHRREVAEISYSFSIEDEYYAGAHPVSEQSEFNCFPKGSRVVVHYKPSDPSVSFLDREDVRSRELLKNSW